jgi:hypothetical protein
MKIIDPFQTACQHMCPVITNIENPVQPTGGPTNSEPGHTHYIKALSDDADNLVS